MTLHIKRLAAGTESVEELASIQARRLADSRAQGIDKLYTYTRMVPRRAKELTRGGSLYWVIKGSFRVRQTILAIEEDTDADGHRYCRIQLDPEHVPVEMRGHRAFQGWRYMKPEDAPPDRGAMAEGEDDLPEEMASELRELGLL